jgi:hypothetical protein
MSSIRAMLVPLERVQLKKSGREIKDSIFNDLPVSRICPANALGGYCEKCSGAITRIQGEEFLI